MVLVLTAGERHDLTALPDLLTNGRAKRAALAGHDIDRRRWLAIGAIPAMPRGEISAASVFGPSFPRSGTSGGSTSWTGRSIASVTALNGW